MKTSCLRFWKSAFLVALAFLAQIARAHQADTDSSARQSLEDAWWTGPMLAPSAGTLPRGHFLLEPYFYDVSLQGQYDGNGQRKSAPHANAWGTLTYVNYGLTDRLTIGFIPTAGYNQVSNALGSSGIGWGDISVQAQYRLRQFHEGSWLPTASIAFEETLPTGRFDRLGTRPADGQGSGAYTSTLAFYTQTYFWLPSRRILRVRFNLTQSFSSSPKVEDVSAYGTTQGFRGHANLGGVSFVDGAWEYSLTQRWVLALDATYRYQGNTRVSGTNVFDSSSSVLQLNSGSSRAFALAPAAEYNFSRNLGVLLGVRVIPAGRNTPYTITPAIAINYWH